MFEFPNEHVESVLVFSVLSSLMNAKLKHMDPSVQCSDSLMTLKVKRVRAPHFLVDSGRFHIKSFDFWPIYNSLFKFFFFPNVKQVGDPLFLSLKCPLNVATR